MKDEELNAILDQMADEVPPMPADFHARWMNAVRAEARNAAPAAEDTTQRKTVSLVRWTRILSVAAAFVFLVGGTLLWRSTRQSLSAPVPAEKQKTAAVTAAEESEAAAIGDAEVVMDAGMTEDAEEEAMAEEPAVMAAGVMEAAEERSAADAAVPNLFAASSDMAAGAVSLPEAEEADFAMNAVYDAEPEMPEPGEAPAALSAALPTMAPTAAPTAEPTAEAAAEPTEAPGPEGSGFLRAAGAFFTDMGDFLLAALPYLLVLAVPAAAALAVRRKKRGNRGT